MQLLVKFKTTLEDLTISTDENLSVFSDVCRLMTCLLNQDMRCALDWIVLAHPTCKY